MSPVEIFHVEVGDPGAPVLLLVHGYPASGIDWFDVVDRLRTRFRVCALDFPGFRFSDKPRGWGYSLARDSDLLEHLLLTNGNVYLPLSNLTVFQRLVLDGASASGVLATLTPSMLAGGIGATTFTPARGPGDPAIEALAATFGHDDGVGILHETIQYLRERLLDEQAWLEALGHLAIPTTVIGV